MGSGQIGALCFLGLLLWGEVGAWATPSDSLRTLRGHLWLGKIGTPASHGSLVIAGTRLGAMVQEDGSFHMTGVPPGAHVVRVFMIGQPRRSFPIEVGPETDGILDWIVEPRRPPDPVSIGSQAEVSASELLATIRPVTNKFRLGDRASFEVRIHNRSNAPVLLVESVDASDSWASPVVKVEIEGPGGRFGGRHVRCGNNNGIGPANFVLVEAGESFDPFQSGWVDADLRSAVFTEPGTYTATFRYATTETNSERWLAGPCIECTMPKVFRDLLARVPAVDLTASVRFEVRQRR